MRKRQSIFIDQGSSVFYFTAESNKGFFHRSARTINIQVICIHGTDHSNIGMKFQETPVVFIRLHHTNIPFASPEICVVIRRNATEKGIASKTTVAQDMRD